jgi:chaperonin GroEL
MITNQDDLNKSVSSTISKMAEVASRTMGPGGRPVLIEREGLPPLLTKDGVTVIKHMGLANASQNIILDTCKEISLNTARDAGDGTTTAIVLANSIVHYGKEFMLANPKYNPQRFVRDMQDCYSKVIVPYLKETSIPVDSDEDLRRVALISANGDDDVARVVVDAVVAAGDDGHVLIQEDQGGGMRVETVDGYIVTSGLRDIGSIGSAFINDKAGQQVKMNHALVVLFDGSINDLVLPAAIQTAFENNEEVFGRPILVFAHEFADSVIEKFLKTSRSGVTVLPVRVPKTSLANSKTMFLQDMAAYTGATVMDPATAAGFNSDHFGEAVSVKVNAYETFIQSESSPELIDERVAELKGVMEAAKSEHDRAHLRAMIGKLTGGIATIWVGGMTDAEVRERRDRVQDAVEAVRSAVAEGIVAGGCATHIGMIKRIESQDRPESWSVMAKALSYPITVLLANCGEEDQVGNIRMIVEASLDPMHRPTMTFDANLHKLVNAFEAGIIEPAKVHRVAIGNALSIATLLVTIGGIVVAPRDTNLEAQMELSKSALKDMMSMSEE